MKNSIFTVLVTLLLSSCAFAQNNREYGVPGKPSPEFTSMLQTNFGNEAIGQISNFDLKPFQNGPGHHVLLKFNLAYTSFQGRNDSLAIMVSADHGQSWETIFYSGGNELSTTTPSTDYFIPKQNEWKTYQFDLYRYIGTIQIRFRFINGNGNNLYLDDLGFEDGLSSNDDQKTIKSKLSPNPFHDSALVRFDQPVVNATMVIIDSLGREIERLDNVQGEKIKLEAKNLNPGLYYYLLLMQGKTQSYGQFAIVD